MSVAYIDTSATYNGDGTSSAQATSDGGVGAYNNIGSFFSNASTSGQTTGILRRLNLGTSINVSSTLSPTNDGSATQHLILIGYPISKSVSGISITATDPYSRTNGSKFSFSATDSSVGNSSSWDHFWEGATVTIHQSGTDNDGLEREIIWSEWDSTNSRMNFGLFPQLPTALTTSATFDLALDTYDPDIPTVTSWDSDTNSRPILDGTGLSNYVLDFYSDLYWGTANLFVKGNASSYSVMRYVGFIRDCVLTGYKGPYRLGYDNTKQYYIKPKKVYMYLQYGYGLDYATSQVIEQIHINCDGTNHIIGGAANNTIKNSSFDLIKGSSRNLYFSDPNNLILNSEFQSTDNYVGAEDRQFTLINCRRSGTLRSLERVNYYYRSKTMTSADTTYWSTPPSGASEILVVWPQVDRSPVSQEEYSVLWPHPAYVEADTSKTITLSVSPHGWTTDLTDETFWIEVDYFDESSGVHKKTATSKGSGSTTYADDSWSSVSVTFTPGQDQIVEVKCFLDSYESGAYIRLDVNSAK